MKRFENGWIVLLASSKILIYSDETFEIIDKVDNFELNV